MDLPSTPATRYLDGRRIPYRLFIHPQPLRTLEQAARERDQKPDQVIRSLLFRISETQFTLVLMPGPRQVYWPALRKHLVISRLTTASKNEVYQVTGFELGAVTPFGLPQPIPILIDQRILELAEISLGSGIRGVAIIMRVADLIAALEQYEIGNFTKP